jgi:hypothetical protein
MPFVDWHIRGQQIATCNCAWGCPCQFMSLPTEGHCRAAVAMRIERGHFGDVSLDGLKWVALFAWPKAVHEGNGEAVAIIDEHATVDQRTALLTILSGKEQEPGATYFNVFASTIATMHEPMFLPVEYDADLGACTGRFSVPGIVASTAEPLRNPVTGAPHRAKVALPKGFEFTEAEFGSSTTKATTAIHHDWQQRHAHLATIDIGPYGPVRAAA